MDSNYLDFGLDSDSDGENEKMECLDSDEEDAIERVALLKMMTKAMPIPHAKTKKERDIDDFEAEMEMELNRRAMTVEAEGGVEHQKSLSGSLSMSSPNTVAIEGDGAGATSQGGPSSSTENPSLKEKTQTAVREDGCSRKRGKSVRFSANTKGSGTQSGSKVKEMYDEIYFDSEDSDEGEGPERKEKKTTGRKFQSNEDLFYDPAADDKDQEWVNKQRNAYFSKPGSDIGVPGIDSKTQGPKPLPNSDAVLNCPACFTLLCLDCQRHDFYEGQYRAMFVMNCVTNKAENRYIPSKSDKYKNRKRKLSGGGSEAATVPPSFQTESTDSFNPVKCKVCNTEVAVFDTDEVYHFYNVLTSHS